MDTRTVTESRTLEAAPAAVARAIASPHGLAVWYCDDARSDRRPDGTLALGWNEGARWYGRWTAFEPERLAWRLRDDVSGAEGTVAFALAPEGDGTRVEVTAVAPAGEAEGVAARWREALADLAAYVTTGANARFLRRPMLGIDVDVFTPEQAAARGYPVSRGIRLGDVTADGAAAAAGLAKGDIVVGLGGNEVTGWPSLVAALAAHRAGETVEVSAWRGDERLELPVTLKARERQAQAESPEALAAAVTETTDDLVTRLSGALDGLTDAQAARKPGGEEWSVKEVLAHLVLSERYGHDSLTRLAADDAAPTWPERAEPLYQAALVGLPLDDLRSLLVSDLRLTEAIIVAALADAPPPVFHELAGTVAFAPIHWDDHLAQVAALRAGAPEAVPV